MKMDSQNLQNLSQETGGAGVTVTVAVEEDHHHHQSTSKSNKRCITGSASASTTSDSSEKEQQQKKPKKRRKKYYYDYNYNYNDYKNDKHGNKRRSGCMNQLCSGILIYSICVSAPVIFGIAVKWYENYKYLAFQSRNYNGGDMYMDMAFDYDYDDDDGDHEHHTDSDYIHILLIGRHGRRYLNNQNFWSSFFFTTTTGGGTASSSSSSASSILGSTTGTGTRDRTGARAESGASTGTGSGSGSGIPYSYPYPYFFSREYLLNTISKIVFNFGTLGNQTQTKIAGMIVSSSSSFFSSYSVDMQFIIVATIVQSLIRVILVHLLVPRCLVPRRLVAFVRNKSSHLLSSSAYDWPSTSAAAAANNDNDYDDHNVNAVRPTRRLSKREEFINYCNDKLTHTGLSFRRSLGHETEDVSSPPRSPLPNRRNSTLISSLPSSFGNTGANNNNNHHTQSTRSMPSTTPPPPLPSPPYDYDKLDATQALRLLAAPRYATAIFRLICCSLSCTWALSHFRKASYWPLWFGGSINGSTKYCWDLSGTIDPSFVLNKDHNQHQHNPFQTQGNEYSYINNDYGQNRASDSLFDLDFDNQNWALRYFFLGQASYQLQSLCFHFLSMIVLMIYGGGGSSNTNSGRDSGNNNSNNDSEGGVVILSARSSFKSYIRPVVEHSLYLVLTITTFFFSALRRLGSISIFALELSSMALQLLQICINAPESSFLRKRRVIQTVHHYVAIPVFVYCRFFIIPFVVQYSALFESSVWLRQIDHAFLPGCGVLIYCFFNGTLLLTLVLNFVYLRRLIFHPHVQDILR